MANPNDATLNTFFSIMGTLSSSTGNHVVPGDVTNLMTNVFCADKVVNGLKTPCVGITDHGPAFKGTVDVSSLFSQLFTTFPDMTWTQLNSALRLYSTDGYTIGVQMNVTGSHSAPWFQTTHASPPLSQLKSGTLNNLGTPGLPGFAVFTFDGATKVQQLQIYIDRYALMQRLAAGNWTASGHSLTSAVGAASGRSDKRVTITIE